MIDISRTQLQFLLARIAGATFLSIGTATETKMNKTNGLTGDLKRPNPFWGKVVSIRRSTYIPCYDYDGNVERARFKAAVKGNFEGDIEFEPGETWYQRMIDEKGRRTAFGMHKDTGTLYFAGREMNKGKTTYLALVDIKNEDNAIIYRAGEEIPYEAFSQYVPAYKPSAKQGLDAEDEVRARTLKLSSIRSVRHDGETYRIVQPLGLEADETTIIHTINGYLDKAFAEAEIKAA